MQKLVLLVLGLGVFLFVSVNEASAQLTVNKVESSISFTNPQKILFKGIHSNLKHFLIGDIDRFQSTYERRYFEKQLKMASADVRTISMNPKYMTVAVSAQSVEVSTLWMQTKFDEIYSNIQALRASVVTNEERDQLFKSLLQ